MLCQVLDDASEFLTVETQSLWDDPVQYLQQLMLSMGFFCMENAGFSLADFQGTSLGGYPLQL